MSASTADAANWRTGWLSPWKGGSANTNVDTIPIGVWNVVKAERIRAGLTERQFQAAIGTHYCGSHALQELSVEGASHAMRGGSRLRDAT